MAARRHARVLLVVAIGCRPARVRAREPPAPVIRVDAPTCVAGDAMRTGIQRVLLEHQAERSGLVVDVAVTPGDEAADVGLRAPTAAPRSTRTAENTIAPSVTG